MADSYDPKTIEPKWQQYWAEHQLFATEAEASIKPKMYVLDMFPYPSGDGLHVGHVKIYTASDVVARYLRAKGFRVLHPTGWDAFGLPTENSAIKFGVHPAELTRRNVDRFRNQMQRLGLSYDWAREVNTTDPAYYTWTQWIFLQLYKMGLAYEATVPINWCPKDQTGLANEEVVDGKCERCGTLVEQRPIRQWLLKITRYADQLLQGLEGLEWPESILEQQRNWIGRSEGAEVTFQLEGGAGEITVFTTRADTLYGATYLVLAPEHPLVQQITTTEQRAAVDEYVTKTAHTTELQRQAAERTKTGVCTGAYALHPLTGAQLPVWIADYVLASYGSGAVMAVPAHDERDFAFATAHALPVTQVIVPAISAGEVALPYTGEGVLINSDDHNGLTSEEARKRLVAALQLKGLAKKKVAYKLRDWVFSRQRYWGEPIPLIHCEACGVVPVPEADLPVVLPQVTQYEPTGTGESPLAAVEEWVRVKCPTCARMGQRETNTMPQWAGSSWYFVRYTDPHNETALADANALKTWLPVDLYIGGAEHAVLHLLYARFWMHALHDAGVVPVAEPFQRLRNVGLVLGEDRQKMSKSRGNVVNPDAVIEQYGADALRLYELFMGPFDAESLWDTASIVGVERFLRRVWQLVLTHASTPEAPEHPDIEVQLQHTIKRVSESTENFRFNTAISAMMEFLNAVEGAAALPRAVLTRFVVLLAPYAPHIAEELWERLGAEGSVTQAPWPTLNPTLLVTATVAVPVQVNGRLRATLEIAADSTEEAVRAAAAALPNVAKHVAGATIARVVYVPGRLINFVTA